MRILIITHSPLSVEFGAGQMALELGGALKAQGHEVVVWSTHPHSHMRWWQGLQRMRAKVDAFIETQKPFDVIDSPATLITKRMRKSAVVVARSTQPDILYLLNDFKLPSKPNLKKIARVPFNYLYTLFHMYLVLVGWRRANFILCLGTLELNWMKKWSPWWRHKLVSYMNALSESDQASLTAVREQRIEHRRDNLRFLWIGRWTSHKGPDILVDFIKEWSLLRPQDTFTLAGCGVEAEKDCLTDLLQTGRVKIVPSFKREELYPLLANHDIGLFTSRVEGWGLVLNEMLESGIPVFSTPAGGVPDLQPFFRKSLRPFPPTGETVLGCQMNNSSMKEYYHMFTWANIARNYSELVRFKPDSAVAHVQGQSQGQYKTANISMRDEKIN